MTAKRKPREEPLTQEHVNGAYGLVLGACMDPKSSEDWANSSAGWKAWNDPRIYAAAMRATKMFLDEIKTLS